MNIHSVDLIGYVLGLASITVSVLLHVHSQRKQKERLARLLDPHVIHQDLLRCRERIMRGKPPLLRTLLRRSNSNLYGVHDLRILQQTIKNVQKYVLVVRSENYNEYEKQLAAAMVFFRDGHTKEGLTVLDEAIALLAAEAKVMSD